MLKRIFKAQTGPLPYPKDKELCAIYGELILATNRIKERAQKVDAVGTRQSRVKAASFRAVLEKVGKKSSDTLARAKSADPNAAAPKGDNAASAVLRRRRDLNSIVGSALTISTREAAVRLMMEATEKVQTISPDEDGYALEAGLIGRLVILGRACIESRSWFVRASEAAQRPGELAAHG